MIPKIIHYCWIGGAQLPPLAERCIASWKEHMPSWQIMRWDETNFDIAAAPTYVKQAYEARKFAFVSDYIRLWALEQFGGLYMDVDFMVFRPFDDLMDKYPAFAGYEGSKYQPVMMGVIASEPHGAWVTDMLRTYDSRAFIKDDGSLDMTPNTSYFTERLISQGFVTDGVEKDFYVRSERINELENEGDSLNIKHSTLNIFLLHVFPVHYFCPVLTTGEDIRTSKTYCEHMKLDSWDRRHTWKSDVVRWLGPKWKTRLIKIKRKIFG